MPIWVVGRIGAGLFIEAPVFEGIDMGNM